MKIDTFMRKLTERVRLGWYVFRHGELPDTKGVELNPLSDQDFEEIKSFFSMPKFFIFGHARSGTTLLSRLIRLHPEIHTGRLGHFFTFQDGVYTLVDRPAAQEWLQRPSRYWNDERNLSTKVLRVVCDFILEKEAKKHGKRIVGDKSNNNTVNGLAVERLKLLYPDAKLIFLVRDGRDTILSQRFRFFIDLPKYLEEEGKAIRDQLTTNPDEFLEGNKSVFTRERLISDVENWVRNVEETHSLGQELFGDHYLALKFEDLISDPQRTLDLVWSFLGAEGEYPEAGKDISEEMAKNPDAKWQKKQDQDLYSLVNKGEMGNWKNLFTPRDREVFKRIAGETLIHWNYENDMNW